MAGRHHNKFSRSACEKLGYYVYVYRDPNTGRPFYVGKGKGNRVFAHLNPSVKATNDGKPVRSSKNRKLEQLKKLGQEPIIEILKYGLDEQQALLVESTAIELLDLTTLVNRVKGHGAKHGGKANVEDLRVQLNAKKVEVTEPAILLNISASFRFSLSPAELYDATRSAWPVNRENAKRAVFAMAVFRGVVREVYRIVEWLPAGSTLRVSDGDEPRKLTEKESERFEFVGAIADIEIRKQYRFRSVTHYFPKGSMNPVRYANCGDLPNG